MSVTELLGCAVNATVTLRARGAALGPARPVSRVALAAVAGITLSMARARVGNGACAALPACGARTLPVGGVAVAVAVTCVDH